MARLRSSWRLPVRVRYFRRFGRPWLTALATLAVMAGAAAPARAQLSKVETGDLRLVYVSPSEDYVVPHAARSFINAETFLKGLFKYRPDEKITVLLADFSDYGNAGAGTVPHDALRIQIAPLSFSFETILANERMSAIMSHELVHIMMMDEAAGRDRFFRGLFGGKVLPIDSQPESVLYFYLTSPRVAAPRWYHEGGAVFIDTWENGGIGRAQGGYDEMVWRAMVKDHAHIFDPLGLVAEGTKIDFQVEVNSYLYGTRFLTWLGYQYSPAQVIAWISRQPGSRAYYASQFQQVFGTSLDKAWSQWIAFEQQFQEANLAAIRKYPITPYTDLSPRPLGSVSRAFLDEKTHTLYAGFNYPGSVAHIGSISLANGSTTHIKDIKGPNIYQVTSIAYDPAGPTIYYTTDNLAHRDLIALDPATGKATMLQKDARIGDLAFDRADKSLWGIRVLNGIDTLVRIAPPYTDWKQIITFPYGTILYDLDVSPDGTQLAASFGEINGKQNVRVLSMDKVMAGDATPSAAFDFGTGVPNNFVFSPDGRYLYGSSYYTGASNIFRYEIATGKLECVSNAETGFFRPIPLGNDQLIVFRYTGQGFVPARITAKPLNDVSAITFLGEQLVEKHPELKTWALGSPMSVPYDTMPKTTGTYRLGGGLQLESFYPIVQGYKDTQAVGLRVNFSDPLQLNRASLSASYSPAGTIADRERLHVRAEYQRYDWNAHAAYNDADFYDLFGPTKVSRKGYNVTIGHTNTLLFDQPRLLTLKVEGVAAGNLDQLPQYQNIAVKVNRLYSLDANLSYSDVRSSLGHVDDEKGQVWSAVAHADYVNKTLFTRVYGNYDFGLALPMGHSSVWLRTAAGFSPQAASEPFANFYFGGFGNNYVDHGDIKRYRDYYAFPGAALNEIGGRNFVRSLLEWELPPLRFSRAGTPGFYLSFLRPAVFVGGLVTNLDDPGIRTKATTVGAQLDLRFTMLSALDMTLSVGGGVRMERGVPSRREAMVSLALLK
jgi:DNA-binding beta-propeller fold protein YncE